MRYNAEEAPQGIEESVWTEEADALTRDGSSRVAEDPMPTGYELMTTEPLELYGLTHEQLVGLGLAEDRVVTLMREHDGDPLAAFKANQPEGPSSEQAIWATVWDMFLDGDLLDKLIDKAFKDESVQQ